MTGRQILGAALIALPVVAVYLVHVRCMGLRETNRLWRVYGSIAMLFGILTWITLTGLDLLVGP